MLDVSIVNETSPEANWNGQAGSQDYVLSQAGALTKNKGANRKANRQASKVTS